MSVRASSWNTRHEAEQACSGHLKPFKALLDESFSAVDSCVSRLEEINQPFAIVCAIVLIKARNLALGCYSLALDGLAQEAGALFRPLLECIELLVYFRLDSRRATEVLDKGLLPKAGLVAKRIEGHFKDFRDYLNCHASHLSLSPESMGHLIDRTAGRLKLVQQFNDAVLRTNLRTLLAVLIWLSLEGVNCISVGEGFVDQTLKQSAEERKIRAFVLFDGPDGK